MCRLRFIEPEETNATTKDLFKKIGMVSNLFCVMANSEIVLDSFILANTKLDTGKLSKKYRRMIYLAVSQFNDCTYCIAYHTSLTVEAGVLTDEECMEARRMKSLEPKADAILRLTKEILEKRGKISDEIIERTRQEGFDDESIIETIATISLATLSNFTAGVGKPELDFPDPPPLMPSIS